jgi:hypothetical protein
MPLPHVADDEQLTAVRLRLAALRARGDTFDLAWPVATRGVSASTVGALAAMEGAWRSAYERTPDPCRASIRALVAWDAVDD